MKIKNYKLPQMSLWKGRVDSVSDQNTFRWHQVIKTLDLQDDQLFKLLKPETRSFAILGFSSDEGVKRNQGRVGAKKGPEAIRKALANMAVQFYDNIQIFDAGDIVCAKTDLESAQNSLGTAVQKLLSQNITPIVLGGGHELAFGHGKGVYSIHPNKKIGVVNFDAHFDLRPLVKGKGNSGTPFLQLSEICKKNNNVFHYFCLGIQKSANTKALFHTAKNLNVKYVLRDEVSSESLSKIKNKLDEFVKSMDALYLTVCMDVFDESFASGVSAPCANGLMPAEFFPLFKHVLFSKKVLSFDVAEVAPALDKSGATARLAAKIIFEMINSI